MALTDANGNSLGDVALKDAFFNTGLFKGKGGIDAFLGATSEQKAEEINSRLLRDHAISSLPASAVPSSAGDQTFRPMREGLTSSRSNNSLYGSGPGSVCAECQRGRDHGIADYNTLRASVGLKRARSFCDITPIRSWQQLSELYGGDINNVDALLAAQKTRSRVDQLVTVGDQPAI